ncbi:hypothetical protein [Xylanibacter rarus]|uniref:hypothetical protein n=1 Tax=Xylanibacter rarus TaxID=1676614 RepID=UPI000AD51E4C|nr:hypothetical protein [Xylanibacter rarus]
MNEVTLETIKNYLGNRLYNRIIRDGYPPLYLRICYEVLHFLNDSEEHVLYFNMPAEEYTNDVDRQDEYWRKTCDIVALALRLALRQDRLNPSELSYPGTWYNENDKFLLIPDENDGEPYYYLNGVRNNNKTTLTFIWRPLPKRGLCGYSIQKKNEVIKSAKAIYRLNDIPGQLNNGFTSCSNEINILNLYDNENARYSTGFIVCSPDYGGYEFAGEYVLPMVNMLNANSTIPRIADIAIVLGDKAFGRIQQLLNALHPYGPIQKLIVYGSQPTMYLLERKPQIVTLTFKDIHDYCAANRNVEYVNPEFIAIDFPWLTDSMKSLKNILDKYRDQIGDDNAKHIYNMSRKILADINFSKTRLNNFKEYFPKFLDKILDNIYNEDVFSELEDWASGLTYNSDSNPKLAKATELGAVKAVDLDHSIYRQVKGLGGEGNIIVIDAPPHTNNPQYVNPITTLMRFHNFARVKALYYSEVETRLMDRTSFNIRRDPLYYEDIPEEQNVTADDAAFRIEDYFENDETVNYSVRRVYSVDRIEFTDKTKEIIYGDVLVYEPDESLRRMPFNAIENPSGLTITYYSQNAEESDLFNKLASAYCNLPGDRDIRYYSDLWQERLKTFVSQLDRNGISRLCQEVGIKRNVLNNHLEGRSMFMRKRPLNIILSKLIGAGLLTEDEAKYVKAARKFMQVNYIDFGLKLKSALLDYKLNPDGDLPSFMQDLLDRTDSTMDELENNFLNTKTIK